MAKDQRVLFHSTIFGPIHSRRLGISLGINLSPDDGKLCSFNCIYCEAGLNEQGPGTTGFPSLEKVKTDLRQKLSQMKADGSGLDVITFSGNGEPTIHPQFPEVVDAVMALRDEFYPDAKVSVLTNSTRLDDPKVVAALKKVDNNLLKLDSAIEGTMRCIDAPVSKQFTTGRVIEQLKQFAGTGIIQTMLLRGSYDGQPVDNTTPAEIQALIEAYKQIKPREIMIYSIDRATPGDHLEKVPAEELQAIAAHIQQATNIPVKAS